MTHPAAPDRDHAAALKRGGGGEAGISVTQDRSQSSRSILTWTPPVIAR
jgi:hypothetical protein